MLLYVYLVVIWYDMVCNSRLSLQSMRSLVSAQNSQNARVAGGLCLGDGCVAPAVGGGPVATGSKQQPTHSCGPRRQQCGVAFACRSRTFGLHTIM